MYYSNLLIFMLLFTCSTTAEKKVTPIANAVDHSSFDHLLKQYVSKDGAVEYKGFLKDKVVFEEYLQLLSNNPPDKTTWSESEQLAYWINAYNAFTIKLIIDNYPVASIKDIKKGIPFVNGVWDLKFFKIGDQEMDLNEIEHGIIRTQFKEPRIHFAVNCASYSCPHLRNEAFVADRLEEQLVDQTRVFLADNRKNNLDSPDKIVLSSIFKWYSTDFTNKGFFSRLFGGSGRSKKLIQFIQPYTDLNINKNATVEFMEYDWSLNDSAE